MVKFYIIAYKGGDVVGDIVKSFDGEYSHVGLLYPDMIHIADVNYNQRFKRRHFNAKFGTYDIIPVWLDEHAANNYIRLKLGSWYDITGIASFFSDKFKQDESKYYCSEILRDLILFAGDYPILNVYRDKPIKPSELVIAVKGGNYDKQI